MTDQRQAVTFDDLLDRVDDMNARLKNIDKVQVHLASQVERLANAVMAMIELQQQQQLLAKGISMPGRKP